MKKIINLFFAIGILFHLTIPIDVQFEIDNCSTRTGLTQPIVERLDHETNEFEFLDCFCQLLSIGSDIHLINLEILWLIWDEPKPKYIHDSFQCHLLLRRSANLFRYTLVIPRSFSLFTFILLPALTKSKAGTHFVVGNF